MALLELLSMDPEQIHYNIPHLPVRLETRELTDGSKQEPHWHEDLEVVLVLAGSVHVRTRYREEAVQPGEAFLLNPHQLHALSCGLGRHARVFFLHTDLYPLISNYTMNMTLLYPLFFEQSSDGYRLSPSVPEQAGMLSLLDRIRPFETTRPLAFALELSGLMHLFLADLCRTFLPDRENRIPSTDVEALENMVGYITHFYADRIQLSDIAAAGKVGRSKCCQIFKSYLNLSPVDFLNSYRLSVSRELLITSPYKVSDIAASCGFSHQSYYSRVFREKYGCTPNEYRLQNVEDSPNF